MQAAYDPVHRRNTDEIDSSLHVCSSPAPVASIVHHHLKVPLPGAASLAPTSVNGERHALLLPEEEPFKFVTQGQGIERWCGEREKFACILSLSPGLLQHDLFWL